MIDFLFDLMPDWFFDLMQKRRWLAKIIVYAVVYAAFAIIGFAGWGLVQWAQPVQAAAKPDACELAGTTGAIVVYYCEPENGPPFYVNNVGFMAVAD